MKIKFQDEENIITTFVPGVFDVLDPVGVTLQRAHPRLEIADVPEGDVGVVGTRREHARVEETHEVYAVRVGVVHGLKRGWGKRKR